MIFHQCCFFNFIIQLSFGQKIYPIFDFAIPIVRNPLQKSIKEGVRRKRGGGGGGGGKLPLFSLFPFLYIFLSLCLTILSIHYISFFVFISLTLSFSYHRSLALFVNISFIAHSRSQSLSHFSLRSNLHPFLYLCLSLYFFFGGRGREIKEVNAHSRVIVTLSVLHCQTQLGAVDRVSL